MATSEWARVFRGGRHAADRKLKFEDGVLHDDKRNLSYVVLAPPQMVEGNGFLGGSKRVFHCADETGTTFEAPEVQAFIKQLALKMGVKLDPNLKLNGVTFEPPHTVVGNNGERVQVAFQGQMHDWDSNVAHAVTRWTILKAMKSKMKKNLSDLVVPMMAGLGIGVVLLIIILLIAGSKGAHL